MSASVAPALRPISWSEAHQKHVVPLPSAGFPHAQTLMGPDGFLLGAIIVEPFRCEEFADLDWTENGRGLRRVD